MAAGRGLFLDELPVGDYIDAGSRCHTTKQTRDDIIRKSNEVEQEVLQAKPPVDSLIWNISIEVKYM